MKRKEPIPRWLARMPRILSLRVCGFIKFKLQRGYIALIKYARGIIKQQLKGDMKVFKVYLIGILHFMMMR